MKAYKRKHLLTEYKGNVLFDFFCGIPNSSQKFLVSKERSYVYQYFQPTLTTKRDPCSDANSFEYRSSTGGVL